MHFRPKYGNKATLLMMDTDSFIYKIETPDIVEDMESENKNEHSAVKYDLSTFQEACQIRGNLAVSSMNQEQKSFQNTLDSTRKCIAIAMCPAIPRVRASPKRY